MSRVFFALYPSSKKEAHTEEGHWLRRMCAVATFVHFGLTVLGLAMIGFGTMIMNFLLSCWAYSCFLTLREREVWLYMIVLTA